MQYLWLMHSQSCRRLNTEIYYIFRKWNKGKCVINVVTSRIRTISRSIAYYRLWRWRHELVGNLYSYQRIYWREKYPPVPFFQIAQYLSERGYVVLRYYKRGIGTNHTLDTNVWGNVTLNDLKEDANTALGMLMQQPEVDNNKITVLGISTFALQSCLYQ